MAIVTRRRVLTGLGAAVVAVGGAAWWVARPKPAPIGFAVSAQELAAARELLARYPSVDAHAHPGRSFVDGAENLSGLVWLYARLGSFEDETIADMRAGGLSAAAFAAVSDFQTLGLEGEGLAAVRAFEPGEAWASYQRQIARLQSLATRGLVMPIRQVADIARARAAGKVGALLTVEGGDFLEGRPERVAQAFADGVRSITLMHYRNNELGDIITGTPAAWPSHRQWRGGGARDEPARHAGRRGPCPGADGIGRHRGFVATGDRLACARPWHASPSTLHFA